MVLQTRPLRFRPALQRHQVDSIIPDPAAPGVLDGTAVAQASAYGAGLVAAHLYENMSGAAWR